MWKTQNANDDTMMWNYKQQTHTPHTHAPSICVVNNHIAIAGQHGVLAVQIELPLCHCCPKQQPQHQTQHRDWPCHLLPGICAVLRPEVFCRTTDLLNAILQRAAGKSAKNPVDSSKPLIDATVSRKGLEYSLFNLQLFQSESSKNRCFVTIYCIFLGNFLESCCRRNSLRCALISDRACRTDKNRTKMEKVVAYGAALAIAGTGYLLHRKIEALNHRIDDLSRKLVQQGADGKTKENTFQVCSFYVVLCLFSAVHTISTHNALFLCSVVLLCSVFCVCCGLLLSVCCCACQHQHQGQNKHNKQTTKHKNKTQPNT